MSAQFSWMVHPQIAKSINSDLNQLTTVALHIRMREHIQRTPIHVCSYTHICAHARTTAQNSVFAEMTYFFHIDRTSSQRAAAAASRVWRRGWRRTYAQYAPSSRLSPCMSPQTPSSVHGSAPDKWRGPTNTPRAASAGRTTRRWAGSISRNFSHPTDTRGHQC